MTRRKITNWLFLVITILSGCEDILTDPQYDDPRERITGLWLCDESDDYLKSAMETYYVEIDLHPSDTTLVLISNFFNVDDDAEALLSGDKLILSQQLLKGGFTISGSGQINKNDSQINWTYYVNDGSGENLRITAVYNRK